MLTIGRARPVPCGHASRKRGLVSPSSLDESRAWKAANFFYWFRKNLQAEIQEGWMKIQLEVAACPDPAARKVQPGLTVLLLPQKFH
jgi:hypothetical protein